VGWGVLDVTTGGSTASGGAYRRRSTVSGACRCGPTCAAAAASVWPPARPSAARVAIEGGHVRRLHRCWRRFGFTETFSAAPCR